MSEVKVNKISPRTNCGTVTLGDSGDTITIPAGATITNNGTQTGFGRTGTVNWVTTKKTTAFTAANGEGYFVDTAASGAVTMTLPASPSAGNIVGVKDYNGNFATANLTIGRNGSPINGGSAADVVIKTDGASIFLVYVDATQGWVATQDDSSTFAGQAFVCASGGTESNCGDFKIHTFTGPGTFTVNSIASTASDNIVDYLVVAGGGGAGTSPGNSGGGGGAGGFRYFANTTTNPQSGKPGAPLNGYGSPTPSGTQITVTATGFPIAVGGGGAGGPGPASPAPAGTSGVASTFSTVTSAGGGAGGAGVPSGCSAKNGLNGGSGGGGGGGNPNSTGGSGNTPPVTPSQGSNGGGNNCGTASPDHAGSGGGGATAVGQPTQGAVSGGGGAGAGLVGFGSSNGQCSVCVQYFAGGGAAGRTPPTAPPAVASGGIGGGGAPCAPSANSTGGAGTANTGGGGGGGTAPVAAGGQGGSGIVVIRYKFQ
jgi:hypothetical protein